MKVLYIDDDEDIIELIQWKLRESEATIEFASSGKEGLKKFRAAKFDLVIVDNVMPIMQGIDVCKKISGMDDPPPTVLITGVVDDNTLRQAKELGISTVIKKDVGSKFINDLSLCIQQYIPK